MPHPKVKLSDDSGNAVSVTGNRLDVNAYLAATPTIDIGDVSLLLGGTAASVNAGTMDAQTLRVTLATNDTHFGAVGAAADDEGGVHAQLHAVANTALLNKAAVDTSNTHLSTIKLSIQTAGAAFAAWDGGNRVLAVRNDTLANLDATIADGDYTPFQVNASGALYVDIADGGQLDTLLDTLETTLTAIETDQAAIEVLLTGIDSDTDAIKTAVQIIDDWDTVHGGAVGSDGIYVMGEAKTIDGSALPNTVLEGRCARLAISLAGIQYTCLTDAAGASDIGSALVGTISGNELQVDIVASLPSGTNNIGDVDIASSLPAGTNAIGKLSANSGVDIGDVDVTSFPSDTFVAEDGALGKGVLLQGDDGSDRKNVLVDSSGRLKVDIAASTSSMLVPVGNTGTFAVQESGSALTALQLIDDAVHVDDAAFTLGTHKGMMIMGFAGTQSVNANDAAALACDTDGALHISDGGNTITVDGTVTANLSATDNSVLDDIAASLSVLDDWDDSNYANVNINLAGSDAPTGGGAESGALRVTIANDSTGVVSIDDNGGAITVDGTVDLGSTATTHLSEIEGAVETIEGAISGSEMQADIVTTVQPVGFSSVAQFTTNIGTSATQLDAQACKHADIMAKVGNAGIVYVGGSSVAATTGIALYPGDVYSVEVTNTNLLYAIAISDNDDLQVVYYA